MASVTYYIDRCVKCRCQVAMGGAKPGDSCVGCGRWWVRAFCSESDDVTYIERVEVIALADLMEAGV